MKLRWLILAAIIIVPMTLLGVGWAIGSTGQGPFDITLEDLQKGDISSTYVLTNPNPSTATVVHALYDEQISIVYQFADTLPAGESRSYWLGDIAQVPFGWRGYAIISSDQPITGTVLCRPQDPPIADFTAGPRSGPPGLEVHFTNSSCGAYNDLLWDFGDGFTSTLTDPVHIYTSSGSYTVTLTASIDSTSNTEVKSHYIEIFSGGVTISPTMGDLWGYPGTAVSLALSITNTGDVSDTFDLTLSGQNWPTSIPPTVGPLGPGEGAPVDFTVQIPGSAVDGQFDIATILVKAQSDPGIQASAVVTTTATWRRLFLPTTPYNP